MISLTHSEIDIASIVREVKTPASGAIDIFVGTTRDHHKGRQVTLLEYEGYEPMALKMMEKIAEDVKQRWPLHRVSIVHRLGCVPVGEVSVVLAVSSGHRREAFEACQFLIDALKQSVPIWKREYFSDGTIEWSRQDEHAVQ